MVCATYFAISGLGPQNFSIGPFQRHNFPPQELVANPFGQLSSPSQYMPYGGHGQEQVIRPAGKRDLAWIKWLWSEHGYVAAIGVDMAHFDALLFLALPPLRPAT